MRRAIVVAAVVASSALGAVPRARADESDAKRVCAAEHERTQRLRLAGKLRDARAAAIACGEPRCPALVRDECERLLVEIDAARPSIVVDVRDGVGDRVDVGAGAGEGSVEVDGVAVAIPTAPIPLEPGEHLVRVTAADGRTASGSVVVVEGEARRTVVIRLGGEATRPVAVNERSPSSLALPPPAPAPAPAPAPPAVSEATPWPVFALGGVGVAALGSFIFFGLRGYREQVSLESSCAPRCAPGSDDAMRRDYLVADVALAAGVVALAAALWVYVAREPSRRSSNAAAR